MALSSVLGFVHGRLQTLVFERHAGLISGGLAVVVTAVIGALFGLIVLINEASLVQEEQPGSRFGPVSVGLVPPDCDVPPQLGPNAAVTILARSSLDDEPRGSARLSGQRRGRDEAWSGDWSGPDGDGQVSYLRLGEQAWLREGDAQGGSDAGEGWRPVRPDTFGLGGEHALTQDGPPFAIVAVPRGQIVAEDLGLEVLEGATARHCRTFMDGPTALNTFLPLRWLLHGGQGPADGQVGRWRGEMDWWVFTDGELGRARVEVSGSRADTDWDATGVRAALEADLDAVDRDRAPEIVAPDVPASRPLVTPAAALQSAAA
jgi:hypothetical protein